MHPQPLAITGAGMISPVGLDAPASCAAIRCGLNRFEETRFIDGSGAWLQGGDVPSHPPWRGLPKLTLMLTKSIEECLSGKPANLYPILLCVSEKERGGRVKDLETELFSALNQKLNVMSHPHARTFAEGRVSVAFALTEARRLIYEENLPGVVIAGADSLLNAHALADFEKRDRLLTASHSDGFIPGEGAAAVLIERPSPKARVQLICNGLGLGSEPAPIGSGQPFRANGLCEAIQIALKEADLDMGDMDFRITDLSGGQYFFKETSLAQTRILRRRKEVFELWHPAECTGEIGAAIGPSILVVALYSCMKGYAPGNQILCHLSNENELRAAWILTWTPGGESHG